MKNCVTLFFTITLLIAFGSGKLSANSNAVLEYSTYLGPRKDYVWYAKYVGIGVDASGYAYVSAAITEDGYPTTEHAYQTTRSQTAISKLNADGSELIYSTFLGPPDTWTRIYDLAVDPLGYAYAVGITDSEDFPATPGAYRTHPIGPHPQYPHDSFLLKLNPNGDTITYATYLGNNKWDEAFAVTVDPQGHAYVMSEGAYKFTPDGSDIVYKSPVGALNYDVVVGVDDCAYITGWTTNRYFSTTPGAYDRTHSGGRDDFVRKLDSSGNIVFSTFLKKLRSGRKSYCFNRIAVDDEGYVYVCRLSQYAQEPVSDGAFDTTYNDHNDVYVLKLDPTGRSAVWSTFLGGSGDDKPLDMLIDDQCNVYITGRTRSPDFPTTEHALNRDMSGDFDMFLTVIDASGQSLRYSTLLGGGDYDSGDAMALDQQNGLYIAGTTRSTDFPTTEGAYKRTYSGLGSGPDGGDVFVLKLDIETVDHTVINLNTGDEYADLQTAIDDAQPSDTLKVGPGRYRESILINKNLTIQGIDPNDPICVGDTIIQGNTEEPVLTLSNNSGACEIAGLTFRTGSVGIMGTATDATLRHCRIMDNLAHGMELFQRSSPYLLHCLIMANGQAGIKMHTSGDGLSQYCKPVIEDCIIVDNGEEALVGGEPVIINSLIQGQ